MRMRCELLLVLQQQCAANHLEVESVVHEMAVVAACMLLQLLAAMWVDNNHPSKTLQGGVVATVVVETYSMQQ
jgi:hypothetical protein